MLLLLMLSCAPKTEPVEALAAPVAPSLPPCVALDDDLPLQLPATLDLESLARQQSRFTIEVPDLNVLDTVDEPGAEALLAKLSADPGWRVHQRAGTLVALQRQPEGGWSVPASGYHDDGEDTWRVLLRFSDWPEASLWASSPRVAVADASSGEVVVRAYPAGDGRRSTALSIRAPHVSLELLEVTAASGIPRTAAALSVLFSQIRSQQARSVSAVGGEGLSLYWQQDGTLDARAWANPGAPGRVWLRLLDAGGDVLEADAVACATAESIGWSAVPAQRFYFQAQLALVGTPATAQLWFQPDAGGPAALLYEQEAAVVAAP